MRTPSVSATASSSATTSTQTHLRGRWLVLVRVVWFSLAVLCVVIFALSLPIGFAQDEQVCSGSGCGQPHLTPQALQALAQAGLSPTFFATYFTALGIVFALVWVVIGALIFWRTSHDPRALFFAFFLVSFGTLWANDPRTTLAVAYPAWLVPAAVLSFLANTCFLLFGYLFPDGRFVPRWTRPLALALIGGSAPSFFFPGSALDSKTWPGALQAPFFLGLFGSIIVAQVYRYRRVSTPVQRQQTKWIMLALVAALLVYSSAGFIGPNSSLLASFFGATLLSLAFLLVPIAVGIAIMRYRLWEVDALINKALVYGLLTGLLGALYAGLILGLESLAGLFGGQAASNPLVLVISTLAVAALVQPVRKRIQALIDRRFYRKKYDAEQTLAAFSATLRQEVDLEQIHAQLLAVVQETMQPAQVSLWLRQPAQRTEEPAHWLNPGGSSSSGQHER